MSARVIYINRPELLLVEGSSDKFADSTRRTYNDVVANQALFVRSNEPEA